jgi:type II secretory pathway pseudopilin PulG
MIAKSRGLPHGEASAGFALIEALVALMLLSLGLFGAASTMLRGQAELRATLMATRAADLAGDLVEQLRAATTSATRERLIPAWQQSVRNALSTSPAAGTAEGLLVAVAAAGGLPASHAIRIRWWDPALRAPRRLELPVALLPEAEVR